MNNKVLLAFIGGLMVASGITYFAMRRTAAPPAALPVTAAVVEKPRVEAPVAAEPAAEPVKEPVQESRKADPAPVRATVAVKPKDVPAKLSAMPQKEAPTAAAPAPAEEAPKPAPAPVPVEVARAPEPLPATPPPPPAPPVKKEPEPATVTIPAGTTLTVRMGETLTTERSRPGDTFAATLDQPLIVDGMVIAERGARAQGRVVESDRSGRVKGLALLQVELTQLNTADGQRVRLRTGAVEKKAESTRKQDAAKVGIGAALGAAIGAIAGGGKGAGIGAGVGGAAGAGDVLLTRGKPAEFAVESRVSFRLAEPITLTEKLR